MRGIIECTATNRRHNQIVCVLLRCPQTADGLLVCWHYKDP